MKILAAICLLAASASAQVGQSGIVSPDGNNIQFTHDFAHSIILSGPSGIVTSDGKNLQLTGGQAALHAASPQAPQPVPQLVISRSVVGPSGIVSPAGNVQFTHEMVDDNVLVGPSGIVTKSGQNIQFNDQGLPRTKRSAGYVLPAGNLGHSGIVRADGTYEQFSHDFAHDILLMGPSGFVTKSGKNIQLTADLHRVKRDLKGPSGMILKDGTQVQFMTGETTVLLDGPSGLVLSDGTLVQRRAKRDLVGPSGMILKDGTQVQFKEGFATVVLDGPSGMLLSDGTLVQKRSKRNLVGPSGMITADGTPIQFPAHAEAVVTGPSGIVFSNGQNVQLP
uniref:Cuticle proprotein proCP5.2 n=1 Tax=Callinectes sapidus TaxID=6763 RepID=A6YPV4_CALSI|nr:cuticle proprotein proCP5.2 [Callinectes sapidus]